MYGKCSHLLTKIGSLANHSLLLLDKRLSWYEQPLCIGGALMSVWVSLNILAKLFQSRCVLVVLPYCVKGLVSVVWSMYEQLSTHHIFNSIAADGQFIRL